MSYDKPIPPKIALLKLLVEHLSGESIELAYSEYAYSGTNVSINPASLDEEKGEGPDLVMIDGHQLERDQALQVTEFRSIEQQLGYQMRGEFVKGGERLSLSLDLSKYYQHTEISSFQTTAGALIDPLVVQFGDKPIGEIKDSVSFNVNQDGVLDELPMFTGDVGYLVYDQNNNGKADNGTELFGPKTNNGFTELAEFDENNDGFIDQSDGIYSSLYIWQQRGNNQVWLTMEEAGVAAIHLNPVNTQYNFYDENHEVQARVSKTGFVISDDNTAKAAHQIDLRL